MSAPAGRPPRRHRGLRMVAWTVAALLPVYAAVVVLYAINVANASYRGCEEPTTGDLVRLSISPESVDAVGDRLAAKLEVLSFGPLEESDTGLPSEPLLVVVTDNDGPRSFAVGTQEIPSPFALRLITAGFVERWPFDTHSVDFGVVIFADPDGDARPVPAEVCGDAHVPGWTFTSQTVPGSGELVVEDRVVDEIRLVATRSWATVAFGIVILALLIALPVLSLVVAILAYIGARRVEATLTSWMAAMLFATVPLRTFLPGSPPVGAWVDYLIVLWVVVGLVAALVFYVAAWVRWAPPGGRPADAGTVRLQ